MSQGDSTSIARLILIPAVITLGVTLLRLIGELQGWSKLLFNTDPGGGGALVGIVWLAPVFGVYFAFKLAKSGQRPPSLAKAAAFAGLGIVFFAGSFLISFVSNFQSRALMLAGFVPLIAAMLIPLWGWRELTKVLLGYGYLARIPVAIVNFLAMRGSWGTHYEGAPPGFPADVTFWIKYLLIGFLPQMTAWIAFTVIVGSLFGIAAVAILRRKEPVAAAT